MWTKKLATRNKLALLVTEESEQVIVEGRVCVCEDCGNIVVLETVEKQIIQGVLLGSM